MKEFGRFVEGADVRWSGTPDEKNSTVDSLDLGNNKHYMLSEVNVDGEVTVDANQRFQRLPLQDLGDNGVKVLRGVNDNPVVRPGEGITTTIGSFEVEIFGTSEKGVTLNGEVSKVATEDLEAERYPVFKSLLAEKRALNRD
jgi:hypothetical protein